MGIEHLQRNKQRRPAEPSLRVVENNDCAVSLPEENDTPSLGGDDTVTICTRCLRKMPCCEGFWLKWISSSKRSLTQSKVASVYTRTVTVCGSARAEKSSLGGRPSADADCVAQCPLSGAKRKTYARIELFRF